jgi:signal peptidase I
MPLIPSAICSTRIFRLISVGLALIALLMIVGSKFKLAVVVGESMLPTLKPGDVLVIDRRAYTKKLPQREDIVMARYGNDWIVKRVVGLPGENVEVKGGALFINDEPKHENHPVQQGPLDVGKGRLFDGDFATLGDNRAVPAALAIHPVLSNKEMFGKVVFSTTILPFRRPPASK